MSALPKSDSFEKELVILMTEAAKVVGHITGNVISEKQLAMVESRLRRRMHQLGAMTPLQYLDKIKAQDPVEIDKLVGLLTTHHTFFFREFVHFEILARELPRIVAAVKAEGRKTLEIWSAACSRGQEVYSLAMFLKKELPQIDPTMKFHILGTDVDKESVEIAKNGVYNRAELKGAPIAFTQGNWARGTGDISNFVRASKELRGFTTFTDANLLDFEKVVKDKKFDVIFCRNVFIYFTEDQVSSISQRLLKKLHSAGLFFSGVSESLTQYKLNTHAYGTSVYGHRLSAATPADAQAMAKAINRNIIKSVTNKPALQPLAPQGKAKVWSLPEKLRVLAVDDSPTVLALLKSIFAKDPGFELVGTAKNGLKAQEFLKENEVDVVTLDIHMPEMDGLTYLEKNFSEAHPAVIVLSSANRDDSETAIRAFELGASDFVEKPALANIDEVSEEIRSKLKMAYLHKERVVTEVDRSFAKVPRIENPENKLRVIFAGVSDMEHVSTFIKSLRPGQPGILWVNTSKEELDAVLVNKFPTFSKSSEASLEQLAKMRNIICPMAAVQSKLSELTKARMTSICVFGNPSDKVLRELSNLQKGTQVLLEELPSISAQHKRVATDVFPVTSFSCISSEFLSKVSS